MNGEEKATRKRIKKVLKKRKKKGEKGNENIFPKIYQRKRKPKKIGLERFFFSMVESSQNFNHASNHFGSGKIQLGGVISSPTPYC